ncbi:hypothetical protein DWF04_018730 [Cereibacter sphaeroides f. sp. denitrificans]
MTPSQPRETEPFSCSWATTSFTVFAGIENPMPTEPPEGEKIAVFMPTTLPSVSKSGPPELPRLMAASVWI